MTIIPMRDLKNTVAIEKHCKESGAVFVTKNGYGKLVVMDIEYYEKTLGKLHEAQMLNESLGTIKDNKVVDGQTVKQRISAKYDL